MYVPKIFIRLGILNLSYFQIQFSYRFKFYSTKSLIVTHLSLNKLCLGLTYLSSTFNTTTWRNLDDGIQTLNR